MLVEVKVNLPENAKRGFFEIGDAVIKTKGDYIFAGIVVAKFTKLSSAVRYVVENQDGILHIFSDASLEKWEKGV